MISICFDCQRDVGMVGENESRWQFATRTGPCDRCGAKFAHQRRFAFEGDREEGEPCQ